MLTKSSNASMSSWTFSIVSCGLVMVHFILNIVHPWDIPTRSASPHVNPSLVILVTSLNMSPVSMSGPRGVMLITWEVGTGFPLVSDWVG